MSTLNYSTETHPSLTGKQESSSFTKQSWRKDDLQTSEKKQLSRLRTATKDPISLDGSIILFIQIGYISVRVWFGAFKNLAVNVLLGTFFIRRYIPVIFPSERRMVPRQSSQVPILTSNKKVNMAHQINEKFNDLSVQRKELGGNVCGKRTCGTTN